MYTGVVTWSGATLLSLSVLLHDELPFASFFVKCGQARPKHCNAFTAINGQEQKTCPSYLWISLERTRLAHRRKDSSRVWHTYQGPSTLPHHDSALALCSTCISRVVCEHFCSLRSQVSGPVFCCKVKKQHLWLFSSPSNLHSGVAKAHKGMNRPSDSPLTVECVQVLNWTTSACFQMTSLDWISDTLSKGCHPPIRRLLC